MSRRARVRGRPTQRARRCAWLFASQRRGGGGQGARGADRRGGGRRHAQRHQARRQRRRGRAGALALSSSAHPGEKGCTCTTRARAHPRAACRVRNRWRCFQGLGSAGAAVAAAPRNALRLVWDAAQSGLAVASVPLRSPVAAVRVRDAAGLHLRNPLLSSVARARLAVALPLPPSRARRRRGGARGRRAAPLRWRWPRPSARPRPLPRWAAPRARWAPPPRRRWAPPARCRAGRWSEPPCCSPSRPGSCSPPWRVRVLFASAAPKHHVINRHAPTSTRHRAPSFPCARRRRRPADRPRHGAHRPLARLCRRHLRPLPGAGRRRRRRPLPRSHRPRSRGAPPGPAAACRRCPSARRRPGPSGRSRAAKPKAWAARREACRCRAARCGDCCTLHLGTVHRAP